jgi:hypothetical protein
MHEQDEQFTDDDLRHLHLALRMHMGEYNFEASHLRELEALDAKLDRMRGRTHVPWIGTHPSA